MYRHFFKRLIDIVLSGLGMIVLSPIYLLLMLYVAIFMGLPVLSFTFIGSASRFRARKDSFFTDKKGLTQLYPGVV